MKHIKEESLCSIELDQDFLTSVLLKLGPDEYCLWEGALDVKYQ